jgi:hypothetical protein
LAIFLQVAEDQLVTAGLTYMKLTAVTASSLALPNRLGTPLDHLPAPDRQKRDTAAGGDEEDRTPPPTPLTENETDALEACEGILERGLATFFEVGNALVRIRENKLYRATHSTFEAYCQERWNIGRSYAWRVMGAAERLKLLPEGDRVPRPANEFQVRPFLKLAPEAFPGAWKRAVRTAKNGKVTPGVVQAVVDELLRNGLHRGGPARQVKRRKLKGPLPLGQVLVLLYETKKRVEKGEKEEALAALERIESLLCVGVNLCTPQVGPPAVLLPLVRRRRPRLFPTKPFVFGCPQLFNSRNDLMHEKHLINPD